MKAIPIYYRLAPRRNIAPEVLVAQSIVETGRGYYRGVSKPWNMAGIKKGGAYRGDDPKDFEVPPTAYEGVRMHVNHMAAYTGKRSIGQPHDRFYDARAAQKQREWWVRRISQVGDGIWPKAPRTRARSGTTSRTWVDDTTPQPFDLHLSPQEAESQGP